jgi:Dockerin type I domain
MSYHDSLETGGAMKSFIAFGLLVYGIFRIAFFASAIQAAELAASQFNNPPFTAGITVDGQGGSEPGWAAPWLKLGGFSDRGMVVSNPTQEGNGAVQIFASAVFGTSVEREWSTISPVVRVDAYVYVTPGASMDGQIVTATPSSGEIDPRRAGTWKIDSSGTINVFDTTTNGYRSTPFHTIPTQWDKYSLYVNTNSNTYAFLFNDQLYYAPHPLPFLNSMFYVDGINLRALGTLTSYVDNVTVTAITPQRGDLNPDNKLNAADVLAMEQALTNLNGFKTVFGLTDASLLTVADVNNDGSINNADLQALLNQLKGGGAVVSVPEPSPLSLAAIAAAAFMLMSMFSRRFGRPITTPTKIGRWASG